jgi:hypothetical protein
MRMAEVVGEVGDVMPLLSRGGQMSAGWDSSLGWNIRSLLVLEGGNGFLEDGIPVISSGYQVIQTIQ